MAGGVRFEHTLARARMISTLTASSHPLTLASVYGDLDRSLAALRSDAGRVRASRQIVEGALTSGETFYGINTGFGALARVRVSDADLERLQHNLVVSHAVGVGPLIPKPVTRLMLRLKVHALGLGYSGVSESTFDAAPRDGRA